MKTTTRTPREEQLRIIKEYLSTDLSQNQIAEKYGLKHGSIIAVWMNRLGIRGKSVSLHPEIPNKPAIMPKRELNTEDQLKQQVAELERQLSEARRQLKDSQMQNLALNTLIDIAEEQGIKIRKKSGAKQ